MTPELMAKSARHGVVQAVLLSEGTGVGARGPAVGGSRGQHQAPWHGVIRSSPRRLLSTHNQNLPSTYSVTYLVKHFHCPERQINLLYYTDNQRRRT